MPIQTQNNEDHNNVYSFLNTSYSHLSSNSRDHMYIFQYENNENNDNDSVS